MEPKYQNEYDFAWTISIIAQVDDHNEWEYNNLRKTIEWQDNVEDLRYVIFEYRQSENTARVWEFSKILDQPVLKDLTRDADKEKFQIKKDLSLFKLDCNPLEDFFAFYVLTKENSLTSKIEDIKSKYHMLITWGHGSGLGYFYHNPQVDTKTRNSIPHNLIDYNNAKHLGFNKRRFNRRFVQHNQVGAHMSIRLKNKDRIEDLNQFCYGKKYDGSPITPGECFNDKKTERQFEDRNKFLTAEEFANIIQKSFRSKMVNVYIANNCWTNMFETGYALRNCIEVYVASQSIVPFAGVDYGKLFKRMEENPELETAELALRITDTFLPRYSNGSFAKAFRKVRPDLNPRQFSISVNNLQTYDAIFAVINRLADFLIKKLNDKQDREKYLQKIDIARSYCGDFAQGVGFIDFTNFFCELLKGFQNENPLELKALYKTFFFLKEDTLLSIINPGDLFRLMPNYFYSQSPQLFSIFFPSRFRRSDVIDEFLNDYIKEMKASPQLWKDWKWIDFLKEYLGLEKQLEVNQQ